MSSDSALLRTAALMSALLNGFNLLPVMPLDGGHVLDALLSRVDAGVVALIKLCLLLMALAAALYMGATIMTVLLALALPAVMLSQDQGDRIPAISLREGVALAVAYGGSIAFYAWVVRPA